MNVIFIGDIVGPDAAAYLAARLPALRRDHEADLVVANADNCAITGPIPFTGSGMTVELVDLLLGSGVDVVVGGSHGFDGPDGARVHDHLRVLRPYNLPPDVPGRGLVTLEVAGEPVSVLSLASPSALPAALPLYQSWRAATAGVSGTIIVHWLGEPNYEKTSFAYAIDGEAAAVLGTQTHEATLHLYRLPGGTALVHDVGFTGPFGGVGGFDPRPYVAALKGEDLAALPPYTLVDGPMTLGAVLLRLDTGRTRKIERLAWPSPESVPPRDPLSKGVR